MAEQYEWEASVARGEPWPYAASQKPAPPVPEAIRAILALEPSEREESQRQQLARYYRPFSKDLAASPRRSGALRRQSSQTTRSVARRKP